MISVIVVDYKSLEYTKKCLQSLFDTGESLDIIVVANGSDKDQDEYYGRLEMLGKIRYFSMFKNLGLSIAYNFGAKRARGEFLFFLNNDTFVPGEIFGWLRSSPYDITGCKMMSYDGQKWLDSAISVDRFGCPAGRTGPAFYPDGAILLKKKVFDLLGGFDEKLFLYGEDRDLCWRAWLAGFNVGVHYPAVFFHASSCVSGTNYYRRKISERNIIRSILKNYSLKNLPGILIQYAFWSTLELGLMLLTNPMAIFRSYIPAYWWNIVNLKDTWAAREEVLRVMNDEDIPFSKEIGKLHVLLTQGVPKWLPKRY